MKEHYTAWIIAFDKENVVLAKWWHWNWWFPKWHIEIWENKIDTAIREFTEETWIPAKFLEIDSNKELKENYIFEKNWEKRKKYLSFFIANLKNWYEKHIQKQEWEILEIKLVKINEVKNFLSFEESKNTFEKVINIIS